MAFTDTLATLPFTPQTPNGSGFFPPMLRAMGHVLYLTACLADENIEVTDEQAGTELSAAITHWGERTGTENVSTDATTQADRIASLLFEAREEFSGWPEADKLNNIRGIAQRIVGYAAFLDRELVGLRDSDPGSTL